MFDICLPCFDIWLRGDVKDWARLHLKPEYDWKDFLIGVHLMSIDIYAVIDLTGKQPVGEGSSLTFAEQLWSQKHP